MHFFYMPEIAGKEVILDAEESRHCIRVLRLKKNDAISLVDGKGNLFNAVLIRPDPANSKVRIVKTIREYKKRNHHLHIAMAPTKRTERFEWFLEKVTEIGIDEITPIVCARSERMSVNMERVARIIIAAMKQSRRAYLPRFNPVKDYQSFLTAITCKSKIITHCNSQDLPMITKQIIPDTPAAVLIGPEGDFTPDEVNQAISQGFREASLGHFVYRTETAGIMACYMFNLLYEQ
jgi:16S rRNA (uracil1498-N3)-methyltransferase